jgi:hemerythrin
MPIIVWDDSFTLGVQQFDEHHQHLVGLLNRAYDDFTAGAGPESVDSLLDELVDYATYHFAAEEHWMCEHSYPKLEEHRAEHDRFSARVVEMLKSDRIDRSSLLLEVLTFLNNWLVNHILQVDTEYAQHVVSEDMPIHLA